ncbi:MAG TPA: DinB family protein [Longimicrobium sp.]|nr:DinB family protein [Longimicrobium sp.]
MHPVAAPLAAGFRLHTRLFLNCLGGLDEEAARARPNEQTNSIAFLALHLVDVRHYTIGVAGGAAPENPFAAVLAEVRSIEELAGYPPLAEIRHAWTAVSAALEQSLDVIGGDALAAASPQRYPVSDGTVAGALAFLLTHEGYHIGQMALLRKYLGHPAMAYT